MAKTEGLGCDFLEETRRYWQPYRQRELTSEDAREIIGNVAALFSVLAEWARGETTS